MPFLFERFWYPFSKPTGSQEPQCTSWGISSGKAQLFLTVREQRLLVPWDRNPLLTLSRETHDGQTSFFLLFTCSSFNPYWPLFTVLRATSLNPIFFLGIPSTFSSDFVSLHRENPTILQAYLLLPGALSPFLSYQSSLFLLCVLAAFVFLLPALSEFLPSLLHWDCSWLNRQIITSGQIPKRHACPWPWLVFIFTAADPSISFDSLFSQ